MQIVGHVPPEDGHEGVHTIDVWFDPARRAWIVERLDAAGDPVGIIHVARTRREALDCVAHWRRRHGEAYLVATFGRTAL